MKNPSKTVLSTDSYPAITTGVDRVLAGTGWGSSEGTRLVLYNLLSITSKVGGQAAYVVQYVRTYNVRTYCLYNIRVKWGKTEHNLRLQF